MRMEVVPKIGKAEKSFEICISVLKIMLAGFCDLPVQCNTYHSAELSRKSVCSGYLRHLYIVALQSMAGPRFACNFV